MVEQAKSSQPRPQLPSTWHLWFSTFELGDEPTSSGKMHITTFNEDSQLRTPAGPEILGSRGGEPRRQVSPPLGPLRSLPAARISAASDGSLEPLHR